MTTSIKVNINKIINKKYFLFNEKLLELLIILLPRPLTPKGTPHELHTNLPDNARSALMLELPHTKHLGGIITDKSIQTII